MRQLICLALATTLLSPVALAEERLDGVGTLKPSSNARAVAPALARDRKAELDKEFAALAKATNPREAHGPEQRVLRQIADSGSDTVGLLLTWADQAITAKNYAAALDLLDEVVSLRPDFAEGYNRRATVHYLRDDYRRSIADIEAVLAIEPRHFGALSGLGAILAEIGEAKRAKTIYERVLAIHPNHEGVRKALETLDAEIDGKPT